MLMLDGNVKFRAATPQQLGQQSWGLMENYLVRSLQVEAGEEVKVQETDFTESRQRRRWEV